MVTPPPPIGRHSSRTSTCYMAGSMPLAFSHYCPHLKDGGGEILFSVCLSVHTSTGGGGRGTPSGPQRGVPHPSWQRVPSSFWDTLGFPLQDSMGVPPIRTRWGYPLSGLEGVTLPIGRQSSRASTCYITGSMPLAFMQDSLVTARI